MSEQEGNSAAPVSPLDRRREGIVAPQDSEHIAPTTSAATSARVLDREAEIRSQQLQESQAEATEALEKVVGTELVSVIVPVFNAASYLDEAFQSIIDVSRNLLFFVNPPEQPPWARKIITPCFDVANVPATRSQHL